MVTLVEKLPRINVAPHSQAAARCTGYHGASPGVIAEVAVDPPIQTGARCTGCHGLHVALSTRATSDLGDEERADGGTAARKGRQCRHQSMSASLAGNDPHRSNGSHGPCAPFPGTNSVGCARNPGAFDEVPCSWLLSLLRVCGSLGLPSGSIASVLVGGYPRSNAERGSKSLNSEKYQQATPPVL